MNEPFVPKKNGRSRDYTARNLCAGGIEKFEIVSRNLVVRIEGDILEIRGEKMWIKKEKEIGNLSG